MYWTPKMHKEPISARFIVASKRYSTKFLPNTVPNISKAVSKGIKLIFHQTQSFYDKLHFCFSFKQFWVIENFKPILAKIRKFNC